MYITLRVFVAMGAMILGVFIVGCGGDDEEDSPAPTVEPKPALTFGLDGDTYRNRRLFKISHLPVDDWTVKEVTNAVRGQEGPIAGQVSNQTVSLLFMQPTSEENFADTLVEAFENRIPYIYVFLEVQSISDFTSSRAMALKIKEQVPLDSYEVISQGSITSKDRRPGYFWEITFDSGEFKIKQSFFLRSKEASQTVYRLLFFAPTNQYDEYVSVYDEIVSSVEFRL